MLIARDVEPDADAETTADAISGLCVALELVHVDQAGKMHEVVPRHSQAEDAEQPTQSSYEQPGSQSDQNSPRRAAAGSGVARQDEFGA